jgi:hypothetical protein
MFPSVVAKLEPDKNFPAERRSVEIAIFYAVHVIS